MKLVVTGAAGFLGQRVVVCALSMGYEVVAVVRPGRELKALAWFGADGVKVIEIDLAAEKSEQELADALARTGASDLAVIHVAGTLDGGDGTQAKQTVEPTRRLISAMQKTHCWRLVLVSSFSVYGYAALPDHTQLDETTPLEPEPGMRDAYCRAKLAQESIALLAAQTQGMWVTVLRPGMLYGRGRWWGPRLGIRSGPLGVLLGGRASLPLAHVENCAFAVVLAVMQSSITSDVYVPPFDKGGAGGFEAINVVDDHLPVQGEFAALARQVETGCPQILMSLPWGILRRLASLIVLFTVLFPQLSTQLPGILRPASLHARCKPLRFCNFRLRDRLGWTPVIDWKTALYEEQRHERLHDR